MGDLKVFALATWPFRFFFQTGTSQRRSSGGALAAGQGRVAKRWRVVSLQWCFFFLKKNVYIIMIIYVCFLLPKKRSSMRGFDFEQVFS